MHQLYEKLLQRHGAQGWWPISGVYRPGDYSVPRSESELVEIIIGAILTQNTAWKNVEKALGNLHAKGLIDAEKILRIKEGTLAGLIKPAGYFNQKAKKLKIVMAFLKKEKIGELKKQGAGEVRQKLLALWGVGPETADSIILYAFRKPVFVVDVYTRRLLKKEGFIADEKMPYDALQKLIVEQLPLHELPLRGRRRHDGAETVKSYNEFHALIVAEGKQQIPNTFKKKKSL